MGFPQGIGALSSVMKLAGHSTKLFTVGCLSESIKKNLRKCLNDYSPEMLAFSVNSPQSELAKKTVAFLKDYDIPIIYGGIHPTLLPAESLKVPGIFGIVIGEGENVLPHTAAMISKNKVSSKVKGFAEKNDPDPDLSPAPVIDNLDSLPFPDREIFDYDKYFSVRAGRIMGLEIVAGRGCPHRCSYCVHESLDELYGARMPVRKRSPENVIKEIEGLLKRYRKAPLIGFHDDCFNYPFEWFEAFADIYRKKVQIPYWCNLRPDSMNEKTARLLKHSGCERVHMGIESGDDEIRKNILHRNISREKIIDAFFQAKKTGLKTVSFNILGLPGETVDSIRKTIELNRKVKPNWVICSIFNPYPGTELHEKCLRDNLIIKQAGGSYYSPVSVLKHKSIDKRELLHFYNKFHRLVYK